MVESLDDVIVRAGNGLNALHGRLHMLATLRTSSEGKERLHNSLQSDRALNFAGAGGNMKESGSERRQATTASFA